MNDKKLLEELKLEDEFIKNIKKKIKIKIINLISSCEKSYKEIKNELYFLIIDIYNDINIKLNDEYKYNKDKINYIKIEIYNYVISLYSKIKLLLNNYILFLTKNKCYLIIGLL